MSQTSRISKNNTVVLNNKDGSKSVILHQTEIVRWWPVLRKLVLNSGGWFTPTTRTRMNQALNEWGLPVNVSFNAAGNVAQLHDGTKLAFGSDDTCTVNC